MYLIFSHLTSKEAGRCGSVCKKWKNQAEPVAKQLQIKEFYQMANSVSRLFQEMTSKKAEDFFPEPKQKVHLEKSSQKLHWFEKGMFFRLDL